MAAGGARAAAAMAMHPPHVVRHACLAGMGRCHDAQMRASGPPLVCVLGSECDQQPGAIPGAPGQAAACRGGFAAGIAVAARFAVAGRRHGVASRRPRRLHRQLAEPKFQETCPVFIEDTDCFGVVFYANYFRYFQRSAGQVDASLCLVGIQNARYASAARLGDNVEIVTEEDASPAPGVRSFTQSSHVAGSACVSARTTYMSMAGAEPVYGPPPAPELPGASPAATVVRVPLHRDELTLPPPPWRPEALQSFSAFDVLRWFERGRTMALGGPASLAATCAGGLLPVVARLDDFSLDLASGAASCEPLLGAGHLEVHTRAMVQRKMRVVFEQWLVDPAMARRLLAFGRVTCVCADKASMKLVPVPEGLLSANDGTEAATPPVGS